MTTKIVVIVRTRDEEHRIVNFCASYRDADLIIVGDGGSIDRTKAIARRFDNVEVLDYPSRTKLKNDHWRNNDSDHVNWLIDKAKERGADWIIMDDCDCRPNYLLRQDFRKILLETDCDYVMAVRIYLWGLDQHFPYMAKPGKDRDWEASLWAWRGTEDFWTVDVPPAFTFRIGDMDVKDLRNDATTLELFPPYALLHYSWDDEDRVNRKVSVYRESGLIPGQRHPLDFAGPLEPLPDFARE
jgi:glycosyltransferase involved in cell wall biosynthesis